MLNEHLLESAINQPLQTYHVGGADLFEIAAAYAYHIVADHRYWDGNKRTGALAAMEFLETNGFDTSPPDEQNHPKTGSLEIVDTNLLRHVANRKWLFQTRTQSRPL